MFTVYKYFFIGLLVIFSLIIEANPPFKRHLAPIPGEPSFDPCVTTGCFDSNTAVTFFGDSRIDLVDNLAYGAASLDHYLSTKGSWNVQNFGVGGISEIQFKDALIVFRFQKEILDMYYTKEKSKLLNTIELFEKI